MTLPPASRLFGSPGVWLRRFRHRCGYGVHSPFAFNFITGVIYERGAYYAYRRLDTLLPAVVRALRLRPRKCARLLFRVANYVRPATLVTWEAVPLTQAHLAFGCRRARFLALDVARPLTENELRTMNRPLLLYLEARPGAEVLYERLRPRMQPGDVLVVAGIHRYAPNRILWRHLQDDTVTGATFDVYDYGIVFFHPRHHRGHYLVNF